MADELPVVAVLDAMPEASRKVIADIFGPDFTVVQVSGEGPFGITYVKESDDPRHAHMSH